MKYFRTRSLVIKKRQKLNKFDYMYSYRRFKILFMLRNILESSSLISKLKLNTDRLTFFFKKIKKYNLINLNILEYNVYKFFNINKIFRVFQHVVAFNFRRRNFFPSVQSKKFWIYISLSLGILAKFFKKGGSFIRSKLLYLVTTTFLRRSLIFGGIKNIILMVKKTPIYLNEIILTLNKVSISPYESPFDKSTFFEASSEHYFKYTNFIYLNSKPYTFMKIKKKGRIKRKITKKLVKFNKITDF